MGVAITDDDDDGALSLRDTPSPEEPPILSKLHDHGYIAEDSEIPTLVSLLFDSMDSKALMLLDRILNDLEAITLDSQRLKSVVSDLKIELDHERHENLKLSDENEKLSCEHGKISDENKELRMRIQELEDAAKRLGARKKRGKEESGHDGVIDGDGDGDDEDGQVLQWRAQSLHQLQELEHMNQALRNALSRYTALPSSTSEKPCGGGHITISQDLAPSGFSPAKERERLSSPHRSDGQRCKREESNQWEEKLADLKRELKAVQEELSMKNREIERLSLMVEASMNHESKCNMQSTNENSSKELNKGVSLNAAKVEEDKFGAEVERLQMTVEEQECILIGIRAELEQKKEQLSFVMDEKVVLEEALNSSQLECKQLSSLVKEMDQRMSQLQKAVTRRTTERDSAEKQEVEALKHAEEELHKKCNDLMSDLKVLEEQHLALKTEHDELKKREELNKSKHEKALEDLKKCRSQLEGAQKETEQLKSLITQLDSTREELVEKLKMSMADRLLSENQVKLLEIEMYRLSEEVDMRNAEIGNLHKLFESLGNENDQLHAEIKTREEECDKFEEENNRLNTEVRQLKKGLENAEQKLQGETLVVQKSESEVSSLRDRLSMEEESRKSAEDRCAAKAAELESLAEHLTTTTCELQLVKAEFLQVASDRENLVEDLKNVTSRLNYCQQLISAKEEEEKALSNSYNQLVEEYQQLKLAVMELDAQAQQQGYQLQNAEDLNRTSRERSEFLEEECRKLKNHVKEMENQVDNLQCSLSQRSSLIESMQREKAGLISQIASLKKMTFEVEEKNKTFAREVTALEANNQMLMGVIQGKIQEAESYVAKYRMEHERVRELDQLVAYFRTQEHQLQIEIKDVSAKNAIMKDRLASLEEQIRLLQKSKDSQREETFRLTNLLRDKTNEENRRCNALHPHDDYMPHCCTHSTESESKLQELERKTMSLAVDLSKTEALYKDCLVRLQKAEAQRAEQKSEYDHVLSILSKVDDDRLQLQQRCRQLVNVVGLGDTTNNVKGSNTQQLERISEKPKIEDKIGS